MAIIPPHITIAGVGPGSPDYVTPAVRKAVEAAEVLIGLERSLALFPAGDAVRCPIRGHVPETVGAIEAAGGRRIVLLVSGDPGLFSIARAVIARFGQSACQVIAGVSSLQLAFARLGLDWHDALIVDAHSRVPEIRASELAAQAKVAVFVGCKDAHDWLLEVGRSVAPSHRMVALSDLSLPTEELREVRMNELTVLATSARTILVLLAKDLPS